jgi:rubrerythrin
MSKAFAELDERELFALAISLEEDDSRIYRHFRERLKKEHPEVAAIIQPIYEEEISPSNAVDRTLSPDFWRSRSIHSHA